MTKMKPNDKMQAWIDAKKRHHLSHVQVQMARELGMNPKKIGKLDNHKQEPWKMPLPQYIEHLYERRFKRERPSVVLSFKEEARVQDQKKAEKRRLRKERRSDAARPKIQPSTSDASSNIAIDPMPETA